MTGGLVGALGVLCATYAAGLAVASLLSAARRRPIGRSLQLGLLVLEAGLVLTAIAEGIRWAAGGLVREPAVHAGYLAATVLLLPLLAGSALLNEDGPQPGEGGVVAVALLGVAAVSVRLLMT